jgi:hypothetical protein
VLPLRRDGWVSHTPATFSSHQLTQLGHISRNCTEAEVNGEDALPSIASIPAVPSAAVV